MHSKFFLFILAFSLTLTAFGQRNTAALSGTTTDQTGATVSNAHVTAVQISTGASSRAQSNESGFYLLPNLPPGSYTVRIEHAGFESYVQQGIELEVDQSATVNFSLKIGSQTQSVTVTGEPPLVDTRSQTLTTVCHSGDGSTVAPEWTQCAATASSCRRCQSGRNQMLRARRIETGVICFFHLFERCPLQ